MQYQNNNKPLEVTEYGLCLLSDWCEHNRVDYQQTLRLLRKNNVPIKRFGSKIFYERKFLDVFLVKVLEAKRSEIDTKARQARKASYEKKQNNIIMEAFTKCGWTHEQIITWLRLNSSATTGLTSAQISQIPDQLPNYTQVIQELQAAEREAINKEVASLSGFTNELGMSNQNFNTILDLLFNRSRAQNTAVNSAKEPRPGSYEAVIASAAARMAAVPALSASNNTRPAESNSTPPATSNNTPPAASTSPPPAARSEDQDGTGRNPNP